MLRRPTSPGHKALCAFLAAQMIVLPLPLAFADEPQESSAQQPDEAPPELILQDGETEVALPVSETLDLDVPETNAEPIEEVREVAQRLGEMAEDMVEHSLPSGVSTGEGKSGVTPQALSLPKAEGSIEGMGESFSPVLSSGTGSFSVPIALPPGRAGVAPALALTYSTSAGNSEVGFGWSIGVPFIARQSDRGLPRYVDGAAWHPQEDRFFFNGGQELVPVDSTAAATVDCEGTVGCSAPVPAELAGWQQYRARVEGGFTRFFRSPDSRRWVLHAKDGTRYDLGVLVDGPPEAVTASATALQTEDPGGTGRVYRWFLSRATDRHGSTIYYLHDEDAGQRYLSDVYYLSPHAQCGSLTSHLDRMRCAAPLADYGRRVRLVYEPREDAFSSYVSTWRIETALRLRRIEITAAQGSPGSRTLVRRYHLEYEASTYHSLLTSIEVEGRPETLDTTTAAMVGDDGISEESLADAFVGVRLPLMRFTYSTQPSTGAAISGFGGVDATAHNVVGSPPHSVDESRSDLFDVNSDGLPDLIVTDPATYHTDDGAPAVGVFFNGFTGATAAPASSGGQFSDAVPMAVPSGLSAIMTLSNSNVVPMDIDGDGRGDLLHMPRLANYGYFTPTRTVGHDVPVPSPADQGWQWSYVARAVPPGFTDPRIDLTADGPHIKVLDVNNDHLVDVVRTTGTNVQTWLNLGLLPEGDGRFGSYSFSSDTGTWSLSTEPVTTCLVHDGLPLDFADPQVRLADMNGDGLQDIVRLRPDRVVYWPGRGEGAWGDGSATCPPGFTSDRHIVMESPPVEMNVELAGVHLADVNSDGADDLVQVRFTAIDVWFNRAGQSFTPRLVSSGTPFAPAFATRVRMADLDGSGTLDLVFANSGAWKWIDFMGGQRPRLLTAVENGLGALTELTYAPSTVDYLADLQYAASCTSSDCEVFTWSHGDETCEAKVRCPTTGTAPLGCEPGCVYRSGGSPVVSTIVRSVSTTDRFNVLGREENRSETRYAYHDGYYEGVEQEFRGFGAADAEAVGDLSHPTSFTRTWFHQGGRPGESASDPLADNPCEALKGLAYRTEVQDTDGTYLSTVHTSYTLRQLHPGLGGFAVRHAYGSQIDDLRYDVKNWVPGTHSPLSLPGVVGVCASAHQVKIRGESYAQIRSTVTDIDGVGNVRLGTKYGRVRTEGGGTPTNDEVIIGRSFFTNRSDSLDQWLWLTTQSWVSGQDDPTHLGDTVFTYNGSGDLTRSYLTVTQGTSPTYQFGGDLGSPSPEAIDTTIEYDAWGNARTSCLGGDAATGERCLRYGTSVYDSEYALVAQQESIATGRSGGSFSFLTTQGTWDRGLVALESVTDPNGYSTTVTYDGLGRITSSTPPPVTGCSPGPATRIEYALTENSVTSPVSRVLTTTIVSCTGGSDLESIGYVDGLGRVRAVLVTGDDAGTSPWIKSGVTTLDKRGAVHAAFHPAFYTGSADDLTSAVALPPGGTPVTSTSYDAFDRVSMVEAEDLTRTRTFYYALGKDVWDELDWTTNHTPTLERVDGHGRVIEQVLWNRKLGVDEFYRLSTKYRADGAVTGVTRGQVAARTPDAPVVDGNGTTRSFTYDSAGRRVSATDPDTDHYVGPTTTWTWRYLFNRAGDLAAVRDPRGCGQNFYHDHAGRLLGEEYVPCSEAQVHESASSTVPAGAIGWTETVASKPAHVRLHYDSYAPTWAPTPSLLDGYPATAAGVLGRQTASEDRGQRSVVAYDARGNVVWEVRQIAVIPEPGVVEATISDPPGPPPGNDAPPPATTVYDETHTYALARAFDYGNRARALILPRDPDFDLVPPVDPPPFIAGRLTFNRRGLPATATVQIAAATTWPTASDGVFTWPGGTTVEEHHVVSEVDYAADGLVTRSVDGGGFTASTMEYDDRRRPEFMRTRLLRPPADIPDVRALEEVTLAFDQQLVWDDVSNLTDIIDNRIATEWPDGHRPQHVHLEHDHLYRVINAAYSYAQDSGPPTTDAHLDWRTEMSRTRPIDPMRPDPPDMLPSPPTNRVEDLTWDYDWLGNMTFWSDDAGAFYERSIGTITNGNDAPDGLRPSALYLAADLAVGSRAGYVELDYGVGGNVVAMTAHAQCADVTPNVCADPGTGTITVRRDALHATCACAAEQHYRYRWDEVNRLAEALRYDRTAGTWTLAARQRYRYDGANLRTVEQILTTTHAPFERIALTPFPGDLERRGLVRSTGAYQADATLGTETQYLVAGTRVVWEPGTPYGVDPAHRITMPIGDLIGTTNAVVDLRSGELLEYSTYHPNGARETFRTIQAASIPAEPQGFTGKEADEEVGLVYFGERYLIPRLARWASPDPLAIHALGGGEAMNSYHYLSGNLLQANDPIGLDGERILDNSLPGNSAASTVHAESPAPQYPEPPSNFNFYDQGWVTTGKGFMDPTLPSVVDYQGRLFKYKGTFPCKFPNGSTGVWVLYVPIGPTSKGGGTDFSQEGALADFWRSLGVTADPETMKAIEGAAIVATFVTGVIGGAGGSVWGWFRSRFRRFFKPRPPRDGHRYGGGFVRVPTGKGRSIARAERVARRLSDRLPSANKWGECFAHTDDLIAALRKRGVKGSELVVDPGSQRWVYSDAHGALGAQGSVHRAVRVGDKVFDNMNPKGVPYSEWIDDLGGPDIVGSGADKALTLTETAF